MAMIAKGRCNSLKMLARPLDVTRNADRIEPINTATVADNMNTIEINGITYNLISAAQISGKPGRKELKLQRPNGRRFYFVVVYENGSMSEVVWWSRSSG